MKSRSIVWLWLTVSLVALRAQTGYAVEGPSRPEIDQAIAQGVAFLRREQGGQGDWQYAFNHNHELGITSLAGLALLENGVDPTDPAVAKAGEIVKNRAARSNQTYDLALAILFLARVQKGQAGPNDRLIQRLAGRLAGGSNAGLWNYTVPLEADDEAGSNSRRRRGSVVQGGDNSNTQFALLGLWAAGRHGFDPNEALRNVDRHFRGSQNRDGHWGYLPGDSGHDSMTCAGLMGLAIAAARPELAERQTARARGASLAADPAFAAALGAVARDARSGFSRDADIYYLWSLERVCVALGLRDLDGLDWYSVGARELLRRQGKDGGWPDERWGRLPNTCLALLFLRKANLAFELDRVLKLPSNEAPGQGETVKAPDAQPEIKEGAGDDASVVVTGASDARFPEISVDFEVKRADGSYILDATRDDFRVTENELAVPVLRLQAPTTREARPITVVLVVDRSRSMEEEDRIGSLKSAVASFLNGLPKGSRVAVVAFGSEVDIVCHFTEDMEKAGQAVNRLKPSGATRYYDAVAESIELIHREPGRRAILALTDGEDTFSQNATPESLIAAARKLGVPIHTLGLGSEDEIESDSLRRLALATRGQYYPARQADQLRSIYEQLAARLRSSYTLVYQTDRKIPDGTLRPVRVSYRAGVKAGQTAVFIPGMVVPAAGWERLFVVLVIALGVFALLPGRLARRRSAAWGGQGVSEFDRGS